MTPDAILFQQIQPYLSLLVGRLGLALLYSFVTAIAFVILPGIIERSVLAGAQMRFGGQMSQKRQDTIARMMITLSRVTIFAAGAIVVLSLFVSTAGLLTFLGLFTAGLGFALRGLIGDYISGFIFLFENIFVIGDDVQLAGERGRVEDVTMRTTLLRAETGETRLVPNGDIRTVYNFSRARDTEVTVQVSVPSEKMTEALSTLSDMAQTLPRKMPELKGRPQVTLEEGTLGNSLTLTVRTRASKGSDDKVRLRLMQSMQDALAEEDIPIGSADGSA